MGWGVGVVGGLDRNSFKPKHEGECFRKSGVDLSSGWPSISLQVPMYTFMKMQMQENKKINSLIKEEEEEAEEEGEEEEEEIMQAIFRRMFP